MNLRRKQALPRLIPDTLVVPLVLDVTHLVGADHITRVLVVAHAMDPTLITCLSPVTDIAADDSYGHPSIIL